MVHTMGLKRSRFELAFALVLSATIGHTLFIVPDTYVGDEPAVDYASYETKYPAVYQIMRHQRLVELGLQFFINNRWENGPDDR